MNRVQKKCLIASTGLHGFLLLLLAFGSAFFAPKPELISYPKLQFVPVGPVEDALARGGGNPNITRTDDVQKGSPDAPKQLFNPPPQQPTPAVPQQPVQPPPPKTEPKRQEQKQEAPKVEPATNAKKPTAKPVEVAKPKVADKTPIAKPRIDLSELKPVIRTADDKQKKQAEEEAREVARQQGEKDARLKKLAQQFGKTADSMQRGFAGGTKVDVGGPGGEAYASYGSIVQKIYEDAWKARLVQDLSDDDSVAVVRVRISRNGRVLEASILDRASNAAMNKSVQRALDAVRQLPPFPDFIKEPERTFTIEFNLKTNKLTG